MEIIERYKISNSNDKAAQFKFQQKNEVVDGGYLTGISMFPPSCTIKNGWTRVALLVKTRAPWTGSDDQYQELIDKAF